MILGLSGCAAKQATPIFYPGPPDPPRYQYLQTIYGAEDLKSSSLGKAMAQGLFNLQKAYGIAAYKNTLIVTDSRLNGYAVFDFDTQKVKFVRNDASNNRSSFLSTFGLAVDAQGNRYVADRRAKRVLIYDKNDRYLRSIDFVNEATPTSVAVGDGKLYIGQVKQNRIDVYDIATGTIETLAVDSNIEWPTDLAFMNGHLYSMNILRYNITKMTPEGKTVKVYGGIGDSSGKFARPRGLAIDNRGRILAVDASHGNFQVFRQDGQLLGYVARGGIRPESIVLPAGITISYDLASHFQKKAAPGFKLEYIVAVTSQAGPSKVNIYGFGKQDGMPYPPED